MKYVLKRSRNKRLNRFRKKYNKKEKTVLYSLFGLLTCICVGYGCFKFVITIGDVKQEFQSLESN